MGCEVYNRGGERPPLVLIQTFPERETEQGARLALALGTDQPVYAVTASAGDSNDDLRRPEGWVDHHMAEIAKLPIDGPYRLCGWSFGGILAVEIAQRLMADGHQVAFVGMIDTWRPRRYPKTLSEKLLVLAAEAEHRPENVRRAYLASEVKAALRQRSQDLAHRLRGQRHRPLVDVRPEFKEGMIRNIRVAWMRYNVHEVRFPVTLLTTAESVRRCGGDPSLGWAPWFLGGFELYSVPGNHSSMWTDDHIDGLAAEVSDALARSERSGRLRRSTMRAGRQS